MFKPSPKVLFSPFSTLGIGSVPFVEGENACEKIFQCWGIPFWPQHPARDLRENVVFQFLKGFPGLAIAQGKAAFDKEAYRKGKREYQSRLAAVFSGGNFISFEPDADWALGYAQMKTLLRAGAGEEKPVLKLQVTGPGTIWSSFFKGENLGELSEEIQKLLVRTLTASGLGQIQRIQSEKKTPLMLIDEPLISNDLSGIQGMIENFRKAGALVGLHLCSSAGWGGLSRLEIDLFHFDLSLHSEPDEYARDFLRGFIKNGKWIAWGVVPTKMGDRLLDPENSAIRPLFLKKDYSGELLSVAEKLTSTDLSLEEILNHSLLAPACGTGILMPSEDEAVFASLKLTQENLIRRRGRSGRGV